MSGISIQLFGQIELRDQAYPIAVKSRKALALLAYLAVTEQAISRDRIAALLWPESDENRARNSLSRVLYQLNQTSLTYHLVSNADTIALNTNRVVIDVHRFNELIDNWKNHNHAENNLCPECLADLSEAVGLYRNNFLADFYLADANEFEEWVSAQRERLRRQMLRILEALAQTYAAQSRFDHARRYARRQLELDNLQESAIRLLLEALARGGQKREALAEYERFKAKLWEELEVDVSAETQTLVNAIRSGDLDPQPTPKSISHQMASPSTKQKRIDRRPLKILLDKVEKFWVEGVLENSLHGAALIELGKELRPGEVDYPWGLVMQRPGDERYELPTGLSMADIFDDNGQALLILGEPGSGKTTMMLDMARTLIERAKHGDSHPIPVVFNLSSWRHEPLIDWLEKELNDKYLIPKKIARSWIANDQLLLLLDGLDEVGNDRRDECIEAINQYRQVHGLVPLVVCSRIAEYNELSVKLKLENAILLQPLNDEQIGRYLKAADVQLDILTQQIDSDDGLREMARTPLMLSIMSLTYQDGVAIVASEELENCERQLFDNYTDRMHERRGQVGSYSRMDTERSLTWLGSAMERQGASIFQIEQLQPMWLESPWKKAAYYYLSRIVVMLFLTFLTILPQYIIRDFTIWVTGRSILRWEQYVSYSGHLLTFGTLFGVLMATFALVRIQRYRVGSHIRLMERSFRIRRQLIFIVIVALAGTLAYAATILLHSTALSAPQSQFELIRTIVFAAIIFGLGAIDRTAIKDIYMIETVRWSWRHAGLGMLGMAVFGAVAGGLLAIPGNELILPRILNAASLGAAFGALLFGNVPGVIPLKETPNQGVKLSMRHAFRMSIIAALLAPFVDLIFSLVAPELLVQLRRSFDWRTFIAELMLFPTLIFLWFGGVDVIYHGVLRFTLWQQQNLPLRLEPFFAHASQLLFLRRVGGAYQFAHDRLQHYFAANNAVSSNEELHRPADNKNRALASSLLPYAGIIGFLIFWIIAFVVGRGLFIFEIASADPFAGQQLPKIHNNIDCREAPAPLRPFTGWMRFENKSGTLLAMYWLTDQGEEEYFGTLEPDQVTAVTTVPRRYCLRDLDTGLPIFSLKVTSDTPLRAIVPPASD